MISVYAANDNDRFAEASSSEGEVPLVKPFNLAILAILAAFLASPAAAATTVRCTPLVPGAGQLAEADIFLNDDGSFGRVEYLTVSGTKISRGDQYETHGSYEQGTGYKWSGKLRRNAAVTIEAEFVRRSGRLFYSEVVRSASGAVTMLSDCGEHPEIAAYDSSASTPTNNNPIADAAAMNVQCLDNTIAAMALSSNEPAETVVRAARGACVTPRIAFDELSASLDRQMDDMMIARVLAVRARAARTQETSPGGTAVQTNNRAQTCDQLWAGFNAADALRQQEEVKPGFSAGYKAAVLGGEHFGRQILAQGCPVEDRAALKAELDQLHLLNQMTINSGD
jgi:hypothetical protein